MRVPSLHFVQSPKVLPEVPAEGRVVALDLAFAAGDRWLTSTKPFIDALGARLACWIDHHPHPAWSKYRHDDRFVLVDKRAAPACPQLVTEELVRGIGPIDHLLAHADFDGWLSVVKYLRSGHEPYPGADEDGRAVDAPGHGFTLGEIGRRLAEATEQSRDHLGTEKHQQFLIQLARAWAGEGETAELKARVDKLAQDARKRRAKLEPLVQQAVEVMPGVLLLITPRGLSAADKKHVLRLLEESARVAAIEEGQTLTVATFDPGLRLNALPGLHGTEAFAWGKASFASVKEALSGMLA